MAIGSDGNGLRKSGGVALQEDLGSLAEKFKDYGPPKNDASVVEEATEDETLGVNAKVLKHLGRSQGALNVTATYDSRTRNVDSSLVARGDLWRVETSQGRSTSGNGNSSLFLIQLGPVLFVRDSTLLLPVHLSKQHLLCVTIAGGIAEIRASLGKKWNEFQKGEKLRGEFQISKKKEKERKYFEEKKKRVHLNTLKARNLNRPGEGHVAQSGAPANKGQEETNA